MHPRGFELNFGNDLSGFRRKGPPGSTMYQVPATTDITCNDNFYGGSRFSFHLAKCMRQCEHENIHEGIEKLFRHDPRLTHGIPDLLLVQEFLVYSRAICIQLLLSVSPAQFTANAALSKGSSDA
jgi:hypothetical protein